METTGLFLIWKWYDAYAAGRSPWLWIVMALATGSFGPRIYLLVFKAGVTNHIESHASPQDIGHGSSSAG